MEKQRIKRCGKASTGALVMTAVDTGELDSAKLAAPKSSTRVEMTGDTSRRQKCQITEFILRWMFYFRRMQRQFAGQGAAASWPRKSFCTSCVSKLMMKTEKQDHDNTFSFCTFEMM